MLGSNLLSIAALKTPDGAPGSPTLPVEARLYARRTLSLAEPEISAQGGADCFMILPELPSGGSEEHFFPALGTVVIWRDSAGLRLRAAGTDKNGGGLCHGWIFDAVEGSGSLPGAEAAIAGPASGQVVPAAKGSRDRPRSSK